MGGVVDGLDAPSRGDVVFSGSQFQVGVVAQRTGGLHEPLAEALLSQQDGPVQILQRARHDLGGRGRVAVYQHDQRRLGQQGLLLRAVDLLSGAPPRADHLGSLLHEETYDLHRLLQDAAAVVAVVENQPLQLALAAQLLDGAAHLVVAPFGEVAVLDVADARLDPSGVGNPRDGDPLALQGQGLLLVGEQMADGDLYGRVGVALQAVAHLRVRPPLGRLAVDSHDPVADADARPVGRRVLVGLREDHVVALLADERTHAAVFARGELVEFLHLLLGQVGGVGIQPADHAGRGVLHQPVGVHLVDIPGRQLAHHVDQNLHVAAQTEIVLRREQTRCDDGRQQQDISSLFHLRSPFVNSPSNGPGSPPAARPPAPSRGGCLRSRSTGRTGSRAVRPRRAA